MHNLAFCNIKHDTKDIAIAQIMVNIDVFGEYFGLFGFV